MKKKPLEKLWNLAPRINRKQHIHLVGIGGAGMRGIAEILANQGYQVSGSDLIYNLAIKKLNKLGITVYLNHCEENVLNASVVVASSAISIDNLEIVSAHKQRIPVICRTEMLAEIMRFSYGIAIAGTHGKTTTTAMLLSIYTTANLDPTFISGGFVKLFKTHARLGSSRYFIVEADESDASLLYLHPMVTIITNIEAEHMDTYKGDFNKLKKIFINFLHNLPFYGYAVMCIDDPVIQKLLLHINRKIITYGFNKKADVSIKSYHQLNMKGYFTLKRKNKPFITVSLNAPGHHNALNAAAAIAVATEEGIDDKDILYALKTFKGVSRRFEFFGEFSLLKVNGKKGTVTLFDDYGHHPTEINATIQTARISWPKKRLVMIFQPHRYTRTYNLYNDFVNVLSQVDVLLMLDVYSVGETPINGANSYSLCNTIRNLGRLNPILVLNINNLPKILINLLQDEDLILIQGAGNIGNIAKNLIKFYFTL
ncbi:UDP-N-acetylmuramate--L-alanine ligase [Candidatus Ecksteinia adelgidicola]|nr:UDP-N-acetylmuramate--L-alanine ligase [Candidatus Ecksteinia adelgidicola]